MKLKSWILIGSIFVVSCGAWAAYVISSRAFLRDFNAGVQAYLSGQFSEAEPLLRRALERRPQNEEVKQLLSKVLIERSFSQYHKKNFTGALETLDRASDSSSTDESTQQSLGALREQLSVPAEKRPRNIEQVLAGLYRSLPEENQPSSLNALMEQWAERSQASQDVLLKRFQENQNRWLIQLEKEKGQFRRILYGGLFLFGIAGLLLLISLIGVLHAYFGRRGVFARLLEAHYQRIVASLPTGSHVLLGPPVSLHQVPESQQMDVIEAEIISGQTGDGIAQRLQPLLEGENPWVRARAAKILYQLDPSLSLAELKRLVADASAGTQVPGMWALSELGTSEALDLLVPLAYSPSREIQQGAIRSLLQLQARETLSPDVRQKLAGLLAEVRSRTGWVF